MWRLKQATTMETCYVQHDGSVLVIVEKSWRQRKDLINFHITNHQYCFS